MTGMIDTLQAAEDLKAAGMPEVTAQAVVRTISRATSDERLATKYDIEKLDLKIDALKNELTVRLTVIMAGLLALFAAFDRFFD